MAVVCALLLAGMAVKWLWRRIKARRADRAETLRLLQETYAADETVPLDVVDGPWDRSTREVHHMTASEFTEMNTEFAALIAANWPDPT